MSKIIFILSILVMFIPGIGIAECEYIILNEYDSVVLQQKVKEYLRKGFILGEFFVVKENFGIDKYQTLISKDCNQ